MIKKLFFLALVCAQFASGISFADTPQITKIYSNKTSYIKDERAVLIAAVINAPQNPDLEIHMQASLNGLPIRTTKISNLISASVTSKLDIGSYSYEVKAYVQNKQFVAQTKLAIAALVKENSEMSELLSTETDLAKRDLLQQVISRNQQSIFEAEGDIDSHRSLVETQVAQFNVVAAVARIAHPALVLSTDDMANTFTVGETATVTAHVYPNLISIGDGPQENLVTLSIDGSPVFPVVGETADHHVYTTPILTSANIGVHEVVGTLWARDLRQSNNLRDAITLANDRRLDMIVLRDGTSDTLLEQYYASEVTDLGQIIGLLHVVLDELKVIVGTSNLSYNVTP